MFHALEVQARTRGWNRTQSVAYWLAKAFGTFAAIDLRNIQRVGGKVFVVLAQVIAALNKNAARVQRTERIDDAIRKADSTLVLLVAFMSMPVLNGCAGTLEETRGELQLNRVMGVKTAPRNDELCRSLSSKERVWTGIATGGAILSSAAGIAIFPVKSHLGEQILAGATIGSGVVAGVGLVEQQSYAREWQIEECGQ
jgi:hypothetical protein